MSERLIYSYEYITIQELPNDGYKTKKFEVIGTTSLEVLGVIKWHGAWRQYCFFPTAEMICSIETMETLNYFLDNLNRERRI